MTELSKDWISAGTTTAELKNTMDMLDSITSFTTISSSDITWWYLLKKTDLLETGGHATLLKSVGLLVSREQTQKLRSSMDQGNLVFLRFKNGQFVWQYANGERFARQGYTKAEWRDIRESGILISVDSDIPGGILPLCPLSPISFPSLLSRLGLGCEAMYKNTLPRYITLALHASNSPASMQIMRRQLQPDPSSIKTRQIAFAAMSAGYTPIPQKTLLEAEEKVEQALQQRSSSASGGTVCDMYRWSATHSNVEAMLDLHQIKKEVNDYYAGLKQTGLPASATPANLAILNDWMPGIRIRTSDIGESSWTVEGYWRHGDTMLLARSVKQRHYGEVNIDSTVDRVKNTLFSEFTLLPQKLIELSVGQISNPVAYAEEMLEAPEFSKLGKREKENFLAMLRPSLCNHSTQWTEYSIIEAAMQAFVDTARASIKDYVQRGIYAYILRVKPQSTQKQSVTITGLN